MLIFCGYLSFVDILQLEFSNAHHMLIRVLLGWSVGMLGTLEIGWHQLRALWFFYSVIYLLSGGSVSLCDQLLSLA